MNLKKIFIRIFIVKVVFIFGLQAQEIERYSLLKFNLQDKNQIIELKKLGLTLESGPVIKNQIQVVVSQAELQKVQKTKLNYEIIIEDMNAHYNKNIKISSQEMHLLQKKMNEQNFINGFEFGSMGGYYTFEEIVSELDSMRLLYPTIISEKQSLGLSYEGRPIWHIKISDNADLDEDEPEVLYTALHHAREPQGMATVIYFMYYLLENYGQDPQIDYIINNRELHFIPVLNPDGYVYNQVSHPEGGGMWRKNRRLNENNSYGVDLNRNYGFKWGFSDIGSSPNPSSNEYRGTGPFSEPETKAIRDFCENHQIQLCLNYHTYGNVLIYPWGYNDQQTPDSLIFRDLASTLTEENDYLFGTGSETIGYLVNGDADDWMYGEQSTKNKIISMTPEVGYAFWPDPEDIYELAEENLQANIVLALGSGVIDDQTSPQIQSATAIIIYDTFGTDSLKLSATISNPTAANLSVQLIIENLSRSYLDTLQLYDDGIQGDLQPGDNIFSRLISPPQFEDIFNLHVYMSSPGGESDFLSIPRGFTTIGPLTLDKYDIISLDTIPNHGDQIAVSLSLKNEGQDSIAKNVTTNLVALDPCVSTFGFPDQPYGNIEPGKTASHSGNHWISFSDTTVNCTNPFSAQILIEISSDNTVFWYDTLEIVVTDLKEHSTTLPGSFALDNNYPNPFNPSTMITYQLPMTGEVRMNVYNLLGQKVATLVNERQPAGFHQVEWDASWFSSGVYYYQIEVKDLTRGTAEFHDVKKMILLR